MLVTHGGPCLTCHDELNSAEITQWAKTPDQQRLDRHHGYVTGSANPSVVHLNGLAVNAALAELIARLSGSRPPAQFLDIDLDGHDAIPSPQLSQRGTARLALTGGMAQPVDIVRAPGIATYRQSGVVLRRRPRLITTDQIPDVRTYLADSHGAL